MSRSLILDFGFTRNFLKRFSMGSQFCDAKSKYLVMNVAKSGPAKLYTHPRIAVHRNAVNFGILCLFIGPAVSAV